MSPDWHVPPIKEFLRKLEFFSKIPDHTLDTLVQEAEEKLFEIDNRIIKEHEKAIGFYIITRGSGIESSERENCNLRIKKGVGDTISYHNIVTRNFRYQTTFVTDGSMQTWHFNLLSMKKLVNRSQDLLEYVWKESLFALSRIYMNQLLPLGQLQQEMIIELLSYCKFKQCKAQTKIDLRMGGILLKGKISILNYDRNNALVMPQSENITLSPTFQTPQTKAITNVFSQNASSSHLALQQSVGQSSSQADSEANSNKRSERGVTATIATVPNKQNQTISKTANTTTGKNEEQYKNQQIKHHQSQKTASFSVEKLPQISKSLIHTVEAFSLIFPPQYIEEELKKKVSNPYSEALHHKQVFIAETNVQMFLFLDVERVVDILRFKKRDQFLGRDSSSSQKNISSSQQKRLSNENENGIINFFDSQEQQNVMQNLQMHQNGLNVNANETKKLYDLENNTQINANQNQKQNQNQNGNEKQQ